MRRRTYRLTFDGMPREVAAGIDIIGNTQRGGVGGR